MRVRRARASGGGGGALRDVPADERFGGTVGESGEEAESTRAEGGELSEGLKYKLKCYEMGQKRRLL